MTSDHDNKEESPLEALRQEFVRVARTKPRRRVRNLLDRRLGAPLAALALIGGTAGIATAISGEGESVPVPASEGPLFGSECPPEVQQSVWELDELSDYAEAPGYPIQGCPTLEELQANPEFLGAFGRRAEPGALDH